MLQRWNVDEGVELSCTTKLLRNQEVEESPDPNDVRTAQAMAGSLLWLSSRTRPDLAHGVANNEQAHDKGSCQSHSDRHNVDEVRQGKTLALV